MEPGKFFSGWQIILLRHTGDFQKSVLLRFAIDSIVPSSLTPGAVWAGHVRVPQEARGTTVVKDSMQAPSEEAWSFDVTGLIHKPGVLSAEQLATARGHADHPTQAASPTLRAHPALLELLPVLACGETKYLLHTKLLCDSSLSLSLSLSLSRFC